MKERPILWSGPLVLALLAGRKSQTRRLWPAHRRPAPGDVLWGRETWAAHCMYNDQPPVKCRSGLPDDNYWYRADGEDAPGSHGCPAAGRRGKWRPSIYLPRWACRLFHEVVAVRDEPLVSISEADALAEGIQRSHLDGGFYLPGWPGPDTFHATARDAFACAWDRINGERASWASNPRVAVVTFRPRGT